MAPELYLLNVMFPSLIQFSLLLVPQLHLSTFHQTPPPLNLFILNFPKLFFFPSCHLWCPLSYLQASSHTVVLGRPRGRCPWPLKGNVCGRLFSGSYANEA